MRKVVAVELVSLDGVMESPEEWAFSYSNDEMEEANASGMAAAGKRWSSWTRRHWVRASSTSPTSCPGAEAASVESVRRVCELTVARE
jgi:hypothetical protein